MQPLSRIVVGIAFSALLGSCAAGDMNVAQTPAPAKDEQSKLGALYMPVALPAGFSQRATDVGMVFADETGRTLYLWSGKTPCKLDEASEDGEKKGARVPFYPIPACADRWPPALAVAGAQPVGDWSIVNRPEGTKQWAYQGQAAHRSIKDQLPGDANGFSPEGALAAGRPANWTIGSPPMKVPPGVVTAFRKGVGLVARAAGGGALYTLDEAAVKRDMAKNQNPLLQKVSLGCDGDCAISKNWRLLEASAMASPVGAWEVLTHNGKRVWGYQGHPLYTYLGDHEVDHVNGLGIPGATPVVLYPDRPSPPKGVTIQQSLIGPVYADAKGLTLYVFTCRVGGLSGSQGTVSCDWWDDDVVQREMFCPPTGCASMWHPLQVPANTKPSGGPWSVAVIPDPVHYPLRWVLAGSEADGKPGAIKVRTYKGLPVYTSMDDREPTELMGHRIGNFLGNGQWTAAFVGERRGPN